MSFLTIRERLLSLFVNIALAYAIYLAVSGSVVPTGAIEAVWFISALSYWFLTLLSAPWFVPPRDAIVSGVGAALILATMDLGAGTVGAEAVGIARVMGIWFCIGIVALAAYALLMHDREQRSPPGHLAYRLVGHFGTGEVLSRSLRS